MGGFLSLITLLSEGALLMVGAQAGFIDGPRVMAKMAVDSWLPGVFRPSRNALPCKMASS